jgi:thiamine-phosphate pyrophosphorylase
MTGLPRGYYAILDVGPDEAGDAAALRARAEQLLAARPGCLQVRAKHAGAAALMALARPLLEACRAAGVPFCVNDRLDVALAIRADVVHLGQDDLPLSDMLRVRELAGARDLVIGFSTHDRQQALVAAAGGADYIAVGPIFGTASKVNPDPTVGLPALAEICRLVAVPVIAIGGITPETASDVARAGAAGAAIIAAVERAADPTAAGRRVAAAFV